MRAVATMVFPVALALASGCGGAPASSDTARAGAPEQHRYAAAGAVAGSSDSHDPAQLDALMDQVFVLIVDVTDTALTAGEDCELMTRKLRAWAEANREELERLADEVSEVPKATQRAYVENRLDREPDVGMDFMIAVSTCQDDPETVEAWKELWLLLN